MGEFIREGLHIVNDIPVEDIAYIDAIIRNKNESSSFSLIGEGGSGKVYRYKNYAIKIFNEWTISNFKESRPHDGYILSLLDRSPYFPKVFYYIDTDYMVCEFIEGQSIYDTDSSTFVNCISKLKEAMSHAFSRGFIAVDLADANIIVCKKNVPVIVDVGCFTFTRHNEEIDGLTVEYFKRYNEKILKDINLK